MSLSDLGARQQSHVYTMIVIRAKSTQATLKIKIVGEEHPAELSFKDRSIVSIGNGVMAYDSDDLEQNGFKTLAVGSIDQEN